MLPGKPGSASPSAPLDIRLLMELAGGQPGSRVCPFRSGDGGSALCRGRAFCFCRGLWFRRKVKQYFSQPANEACSAVAAPDCILNF